MDKHPIRFGVQTGQQNIDWEQLRSFWAKADGWGYDSLWVFRPLLSDLRARPDRPVPRRLDSAECAQPEHQARAYRRAGQRQHLSQSVRSPRRWRRRSTTSAAAGSTSALGAGWFEAEHHSLGFDFKTIPGRLQALDESCQIIKGMFTQEKTTLKGKHYNVVDAVCNPKPMQKNLPLMIGGHGEKVLLKIVAKHADMWNMGNADAAEMKRLIGVIERHGDTVGRDTDEIEKTLMLALCYKAPKQREEMLSSVVAMMAQTTPELARERMIIGSKQECVDKIEGYTQGGRHAFHFHAQPAADRRGGHPGLRRGHHPAVPFAVNLSTERRTLQSRRD